MTLCHTFSIACGLPKIPYGNYCKRKVFFGSDPKSEKTFLGGMPKKEQNYFSVNSLRY